MKTRTVCLINPPHSYLKQPDAQAPLGLLYIASSLRNAGHRVTFVNLNNIEQAAHPIYGIKKSDIYGITATVLDINQALKVASFIRQYHKDACIVIGGPASLSPKHIDKKLINTIVQGEGEIIIHEVVNDYPNTKPFYQASRIMNLDNLPFPARDLLPRLGGDVFVNQRRYYGDESTVISTSRGCPFECTYCASPRLWGRKIVYRSPASIVKEMYHVIQKFGVNQFRFSDDNLTCNRDSLTRLCTSLEDMKIAWRASIRVTPNDVDMFKMMKKAGCVEVSFGIESGDADVLNALRKKAAVDDNRRAIVNAKEAGLDVRALFMIGTPGETNKTVDRNINFLETVNGYYDSIAVTNFTPLPGSEVAENPKACGCEILCDDIEKYNLCLWGPKGKNTWYNHIKPVGISLEELTENKERMIEYVLSTGKSNHG